MAKVTGGLFSMTASGKFGDIVFDQRGFVRKFQKPSNPQTVNQMAQRNKLADIQGALKLMGPVIRADLKSGLGYRWNSLLIKELLSNGGAALTAYTAEFTAFTSQQKTDWDTADASIPTALAAGLPLYAVASAVYDLCARLGVDVTITQPAAGNSVTVGGEWTA